MPSNPFEAVKKALKSSSRETTPSPPGTPSRNHSVRDTEHWDEPVPGLYEHIPGRGWYLIKRDSAAEDEKFVREPVIRSSILHKWILRSEVDRRTRVGKVMDEDKGVIVVKRFFCLDDEVAWINCWEDDGSFKPGPWERFCVDDKTGIFRKMLVGDDPAWRTRREHDRKNKHGKSAQTPISRTGSPTNVPTK